MLQRTPASVGSVQQGVGISKNPVNTEFKPLPTGKQAPGGKGSGDQQRGARGGLQPSGTGKVIF